MRKLYEVYCGVLTFFKNNKKEKKAPVYCEDCRFLKITDASAGDIINEVWHWYERNRYVCNNPNLITTKYDKETFLNKGTGKLTEVRYKSCASLNEKNDCFWFKQKEK